MPKVLSSHELAPYASHMSLFLSDRDSSSDVDYGDWHQRDVALRRVLVTQFELQVATARYDVVPVRLRVLDEAPGLEADPTHVVDADLQVPSGVLLLHSVADDWDQVPRLPVEPGRYRVRVSYVPRATPAPGADLDAPGDHLDYLIDLWPVAAAEPPAIVKQGAEVWAG